MRKTYVVSAKRSAIGSFLGSLTTVKPVDLGATVVKALLEDAHVAPENVDELLCGNVLSAGLGQNIGRQVALAAGIPESGTATTTSASMLCSLNNCSPALILDSCTSSPSIIESGLAKYIYSNAQV